MNAQTRNAEAGFFMRPMTVNPINHYWIIAGSTTHVYSSATNTLVLVSEAAYVAWLAAFNMPSKIDSEKSLSQVLKAYDDLLPDWLFNAPSFIQPSTGAYTPDQLKAYNNDARWRKEQAGVTATAGWPIKTDDRAQTKITGLHTAAAVNPNVITPFLGADGVVHPLDAAGMTAVHIDLLTHINDCFSRSGDVHNQIDAGTITTLAQVDAVYAAAITAARKNWLRTTTPAAPAAKKEPSKKET